MPLPDIPPQQRGWMTTGLFEPAPWGRTLHPVVLEAWVTFTRQSRVKDGSGGYQRGNTNSQYLQAWCHIEVEKTQPFRLTGGSQTPSIEPVQTRYYSILMPVAALGGDPALLPQKSDRVAFVDSLGRARDMPLATTPDIPINGQEMIVMTTDEFE